MFTVATSSRVPFHLLLVLCLACFFAGRFWRSSEFLPDLRDSGVQTDVAIAHSQAQPLQAGHAFLAYDAHPQSDAEDTVQSASSATDSDAKSEGQDAGKHGSEDTDVNFLFPLHIDNPTYPGPKELQQLLNLLGLKDRRPLLDTGESGERVYHSIPFQVLSWQPRLLLLPNFLTKKKCKHLVAVGREAAESLDNGGDDSDGMMLGPVSDDSEGVVEFISAGVAAFTRLPANLQEPVMLYHYKAGQSPAGYPPNWQTEKRHLASVMVFLSEVEEGGDTVFPFEGRGGASRQLQDNDACRTPGVYRVPPRMGDALLVWRLDYQGEIEQASEHWTCPTAGEEDKWVAVMRIYEAPRE